MEIAERLKTMAEKGDSLAAYYLGKYYYSEHIDINKAIYWLLRSSRGTCNNAVILLKKLQERYPKRIKEAEKQLKGGMMHNYDIKNVQPNNY